MDMNRVTYQTRCHLSDQVSLIRQVQHEGKEKVSTINSSPDSPSVTNLWSEYSCWHLVRTPALARCPRPHSSPAPLHCVMRTSCVYSSSPSGWFTMNRNFPSLFLAALGVM